MHDTTRELIAGIHASGRRFVVAVTGGGSGAIADLLAVPGGSRSLLEAVVPYAATAIDEWLGGMPDQYCSERTARAMAMAAFLRAGKLAPDANPHTLVGIGCTASLVSDRPKRGPHRIHVAWQTSRRTGIESLELTKGVRDRIREERIAKAMVSYAMCFAVDAIDENVARTELADMLVGSEQPVGASVVATQEWTQLLLGERRKVLGEGRKVLEDEIVRDEPAFSQSSTRATGPPTVVFPGAFNPIHSGHRRMAEIAAARAGAPVWFELSVTNVDKLPLDFIEIGNRLDRLGDLPVVLTRAATFTEKAALFPGATFVVGADTLKRIADPRYYAGVSATGVLTAVPARATAAIRTIASHDCRFLIFGRTIGGRFVGLDDLDLPDELRTRCDAVPEREFREDISSSEMRG